jgi:hypothetical protein
MCASCVSQGALYLGGSAAALRVMARRAGRRRTTTEPQPEPAEAASVDDGIAAAPR